MLVSEFDYQLPDELIAQHPAARGRSRLLVLDRASGRIEHKGVIDLPGYLQPADVLAINDTRVFPARLIGHRVPSGGAVECLLLTPPSRLDARDDPGTPAPQHAGTPAPWHPGLPAPQHPGPPAPRHTGTLDLICDALMHPGQKLKPGAVVRFEGTAGVLMAEVLERKFHGRRTIRLWAEGGADGEALIDALGHVPLPPYIKRPDAAADRERYQTVFAKVRGSVAAPTAGLHFTHELLAALDRRGIVRAPVTLHVGYGTFKPVRTEIAEEHVVDPEHYEVPEASAAAINGARDSRRRVLAVGTTTTRALEDAAIRGNGRVPAGGGMATVFIVPGFHFQVIDAVLTNFHLPRSSLLMLACAFGGREHVLAAYREAVARRYRFYSYGDAMLIV